MKDETSTTPKKSSEYFLQALQSLVGIFINLAKGIYFSVKNNIPWAVVLALFCVFHVVRIMQVRAERDAYNHKCIILEEKIDSLQPKNISYIPFNE